MSNPGAAMEAPGFAGGRGCPAFLTGLVIYTLYVFSVALVPIRADNDCWWHVKTGQYIAQNGLPENDVFSYTAADHEWHNHEWLAQVAFYHVFAMGDNSGFGGWRAVILFVGIILWATHGIAYWLAGRLSGSWWVGLLVAVLSVAIARRTFYPRPPVVSNLILMGEVALLVSIAGGWIRRGWIYVLVPVIALWTNLHGAWMAGGVVLAAFAADQGLQGLRDRLPRLPFAADASPVPLRTLFVLLPLCLLATLANPYGWRLYELPARVLSDTALVRSIGELRSPDFYFVIDFEMAIHAAFFLALCLTRFRPRLFEMLIWIFFLHQAIQHVRHLLLFGIMLVPLYARLAGAAVDAARTSLAEWRPGAWWRAVPAPAAGIAALVLAGWVIVNPREGGRPGMLFDRESFPATYTQRNFQFLSGLGYLRERYPASLCDFVELAEPAGNMFNENFYAGYLIWRLSPEKHRVFSDSRFDIFGGEIWRMERLIAEGGETAVRNPQTGAVEVQTWRTELDRWDIQWLIVLDGSGLQARLRGQPVDWVLVADWSPADSWQVWMRRMDSNEAMIRRARATAPLVGATAP